jgi:hypothetical protein
LLLINTFCGIFILVATSIGVVSHLGLLLIICFVSSFIYLTAYQKGWMRDGSRLQAIAESNLLLPGLLALIWSAAGG